MHPYVHRSAIHNSQDMEATEMSINRGMAKEDVVHIYNGILLSHEKESYDAIATTWMDLGSVVLSEVSQAEKEKYWMTSLICEI